MRRNALVVVTGVALVVLTVASYKVYDAQATRINVIALVSDTMERLRAALAAQASGSSTVDVQAHATAAEAHVAALRSMIRLPLLASRTRPMTLWSPAAKSCAGRRTSIGAAADCYRAWTCWRGT
jgi:hypothetical protein